MVEWKVVKVLFFVSFFSLMGMVFVFFFVVLVGGLFLYYLLSLNLFLNIWMIFLKFFCGFFMVENFRSMIILIFCFDKDVIIIFILIFEF